MNSQANGQSQLMVRFVTKSTRYSVADTPYSIPALSDAESLNQLLKGIIKSDLMVDGDGDDERLTTAEFDFFVDKIFLETSLIEFLKAHEHITTESVIDIEYSERCPPPEPLDTVQVDDWVSSIKGHSTTNQILLGSYDNSIQIWSTSGQLVKKFDGHNGAVKAVAWLSADDSSCKFVSASQDQSVIVWDWNRQGDKVLGAEKCVGHTESVDCIAVNAENTKFISGSWDKTIKLWSLVDDLVEESITKKNKSDINMSIKTPIFTLSGHTESVSSVKWMSDKNACTGSWDHSIKLWDIFIGQETRSLKSANKIYLALDYSPLNELIAAGLNDSYIRLYDPRSTEGNIVKITLSSHTGWCTSVCWSTTDSNLLVSGSHDMKTKLWDIRNPKSSVYDMVGHEDKILCVDWSMPSLILSGSSDNTFKMYKTN